MESCVHCMFACVQIGTKVEMYRWIWCIIFCEVVYHGVKRLLCYRGRIHGGYLLDNCAAVQQHTSRLVPGIQCFCFCAHFGMYTPLFMCLYLSIALSDPFFSCSSILGHPFRPSQTHYRNATLDNGSVAVSLNLLSLYHASSKIDH